MALNTVHVKCDSCPATFEVFATIAAHTDTLTCLKCQKKAFGAILTWPLDFYSDQYKPVHQKENQK